MELALPIETGRLRLRPLAFELLATGELVGQASLNVGPWRERKGSP